MTDHPGHSSGREPDGVRLAAIEACREVIHRSFTLADAGRRAEIAELFVADGVQTIDGETAHGQDAIRALFAARDRAGRQTVHAVTTMTVDSASESEVRTRSVVLVFSPSGADPTTPIALTAVDDRLVRDGDVWRLSNRVTSVVGRRAAPAG